MPTVNVKVKGLKEAMAMFDPKKVKKAAASALKKVAQQARTEASSVIREKYDIKKSDLDKKIEVRAPRYGSEELVAYVTISSKRGISLIYFSAKNIKGNKVTTRKVSKVLKRAPGTQGVFVRILKDGKVAHLPKSFIATMKSGHIGVFVRKRGSGKILERSLVTESTLFKSKRTIDAIQKKVSEQWPKVFQQEMNYQLTQR